MILRNTVQVVPLLWTRHGRQYNMFTTNIIVLLIMLYYCCACSYFGTGAIERAINFGLVGRWDDPGATGPSRRCGCEGRSTAPCCKNVLSYEQRSPEYVIIRVYRKINNALWKVEIRGRELSRLRLESGFQRRQGFATSTGGIIAWFECCLQACKDRVYLRRAFIIVHLRRINTASMISNDIIFARFGFYCSTGTINFG